MQINYRVVRWLLLWIVISTLIVLLPTEVMLEGSLALGAINLVVLEVTYAEMFEAPLRFLMRVVSLTLFVHGASGFALEGFCQVYGSNNSVQTIVSGVCCDDHLDVGLIIFIAIFALLGSVFSGLMVFLYNRQRLKR